MNLKIIFENNDIVVLDKPAGLLVHPTHKQEKDTLVDWLIKKYPEIKSVGDDPNRPGIVHRLDKDTSGLIVAAKNSNVFEYLKKQFAEREIEKKYIALVHGKIKDKKGIITKSISVSKKGRYRRSALLDEKSKKAWTEYKVIREYKDYSLLEVMPKTGRTHQIRVHLASIGHPIVGDKQYKFKRRPTPKGLVRQFLHAKHLKFKLSDGKMVEFKSDLPKDLEQILEYL